MDEISVTEFFETIYKRKYFLFPFILIFVTIVAIYALTLDPLYQTTAKILIGREKSKTIKINEVLVQDPDSNDFLNTQIDLLKSRSLARDVIKLLNLENNKEFLEKPSRLDWEHARKWIRSFSDSPEQEFVVKVDPSHIDPYTAMIDIFLDRLTITSIPDSQIVYINFKSHSPSLVADITNTLAETFIVKNLESQSTFESDTENWLKIRINELQEDIRKSEQELQNYKDKKNSIDFGENRDFAADNLNLIAKEHLQIQSERLRLGALLREYEELRSSNVDPINTFLSLPLSDNRSLLQLRKEYLDLKSEFESSLKNKTPKHPDTISLAQKMSEVKSRIPIEIDLFFNAMKINYKSAMTREKSLNNSIKAQKLSVMELDKDAIQFSSLKQEVDSNKNLYTILSNRLKELNISSNYKEINIRIIDRAEIPIKPFKPDIKLYIFTSLTFGLFFGVLIIFMVESKDKIVKDENDIQTRFPYPFMGSIGLMSRRELKLFGLGVHSVRSEEIRELRFKLLSSILKKSKKIVLITSASPGEGKATLTSDLAISLAQAGKKVAIIDTDFQNSKIHEIFSTPNSPGLAEGLSDPRKIKWIFHNTQYNRIWVVPPGEINPESPLPFDVLLSEKFKPFLNKLRNNVDVILIKAPPVLSALEASIIENNCEGILFVVESGIHNDETIKQAIEKLSSSQLELKSQSQYGKKEDNIYPLSKTPGKPPKTLGIVLNKVKSKSNDKRKIKYPNSSVWKNLKSSASSVDVFSKWHMVSFFVLLFVISFSLIPSYPFNNEFLSSPPGDFLAHSAAYGLLMFSLCQVWIQNRSRILVGLTLVFLGVVFEYFQNYIVGRTFAITDIGADFFGILLGYLVSMFTQRNQLERSPIDETIYTESQSADEYRRTMTSG